MKLVVTHLLITMGVVAGVPVPEAPGIPTPSAARSQLNGLKVASSGSSDGYTRAKFPHWEPIDGKCDAREFALKRDGTNVQTKSDCSVTSGRWQSPYDGATWTNPLDLDIDHMVPLKDAWVSGASSWTTTQRKNFANDVTRPQLWTVTNTINRSKGDRSPDSWKPPLKTFHCKYAESWVQVKSYYSLTVTMAEKAALSQMLDTCAGTPSNANLNQLQRVPYFGAILMAAIVGLM
ncbi:hypothetical protein VHEMI07890 [[Torrubiella] hemipterigena]|uniref:GmrSD restriction endonucleases C-terminal domain-containing protein n=1 Tax=[Torrubiella] hemipterigena TaxID=1531966 RepID=A0A0A1TBU7_9HYPO|nr:hypothetical protein VHEMI07890 [[Torrubiella] hemipterigena]